ncbi:MAG: diguanylate cyclase [Nitrospirota bacterium]|nr:diguanylate cyclase [Nitrospirota bacterium]
MEEPAIKKNTENSQEVGAEYFCLDLIPDPFIILHQDGRILDVNESCSLLLGSVKDELIGKTFEDFREFTRLREKAEQAVREKKEAVERVTLNNRNFEVSVLPFESDRKTCLLRITFKDITNFLRLELELLKRNKELIIINSLSSAFISSDNIDLAMEELMDKVFLITDFHTGWLLLKEDDSFLLQISRGISPELQQGIETGVLASLCAETIEIGAPLHFVESSDISKISLLRDEGIIFLVIIPLISENKHIGLLFLASRVGRDFDFDFASLLTLVGNHVSHIIDKIRMFQETRRLSITDSLTGLHNTRYFYRTLDLEIARTDRYGTPFSLMLFDIDNFKQLNDTHGHQAGDEVLQELAKILKAVSRETDTVVRYGGEEFIIILPNTPEEETVHLSDRIRRAVQENIFFLNNSEKIKITLSGGIASYPKNARDAKNLLNAADTALYAAKAAGKNVVLCYEGFNW